MDIRAELREVHEIMCQAAPRETAQPMHCTGLCDDLAHGVHVGEDGEAGGCGEAGKAEHSSAQGSQYT